MGRSSPGLIRALVSESNASDASGSDTTFVSAIGDGWDWTGGRSDQLPLDVAGMGDLAENVARAAESAGNLSTPHVSGAE